MPKLLPLGCWLFGKLAIQFAEGYFGLIGDKADNNLSVALCPSFLEVFSQRCVVGEREK